MSTSALRVLLLSRYGELGASSRLRSFQYLPHLASRGLEVEVAPLFGDRYVRSLYAGHRRDWWGILSGYASRARRLLGGGGFDLLWVEKELLPWWPAWSEIALLRGGPPLVLDLDDAIFHRYDHHGSPLVRAFLGRKIDALMRTARLVIAGNAYLAERARGAGAARVEILPTVVDLERYGPRERDPRGVFTIGWIGSPGTSGYLERVFAPLERVASAASLRILLVGASQDALDGLPVERRPWSLRTEVADLQEFDVGIMPLPDDPFERGKCGYKLVQYMACAKPVVASPVGVNRDLVEPAENGYLAATDAEWTRALGELAAEPALRARLGTAGRRRVETAFSLEGARERLAELLRSAATAG